MSRNFQSRFVSILTSPPFLFLLLALAIMGWCLLPGQLFALDSPLALNKDISGYFWGTSDGASGSFAATYNSAPIAFVLSLFEYVMPAWAVEKCWLVLLLWLCGYGAFRLPFLKGFGRYFAGVFYVVNPVVYLRFVSGGWGVLAVYAVTPFLVSEFVKLLESPRQRYAVNVALLLTSIGILQIHGVPLAFMLLTCIFIGRLLFLREHMKKTFMMLSISGALFLCLNLFWITRFLEAGGGAPANMPLQEMNYFAVSSALEALSLRGFWCSQPYIDISDLIPFGWILFVPLLCLVIFGAFSMVKSDRSRWLGIGVVALAVLSGLLAIGPRVDFISGFIRFLWENVSVYRAFRDSYKFVGLLALAYAFLGAYGLQSLLKILHATFDTESSRRLSFRIVGVIALILPVLYTLPLFGLWGQMPSTTYPADWTKVRAMMDEDKSDFNVLVLPWHMYLEFPWLENRSKRLANPASNFFTQPTLTGDNLEIEGSSSNSSNPVSAYIEAVLKQGDEVRDMGKLIAPLNARYIVLFKAADIKTYDYLASQKDLERVFDGPTVALYRNSYPTARAYTVNTVARLKNLADCKRVFSAKKPLENLFVLDSTQTQDLPPTLSQHKSSDLPKIQIETPANYRIETQEEGYLVFSLAQRTNRNGWELNGKQPIAMNLGMAPTFSADAGIGSIKFSRFYSRELWMYCIAALGLVACAAIYRRGR